MDNMFRHLHIQPELACKFLAVFSRMEYALKSTKFAIGNNSKVEPAWDHFANQINNEFLTIEEPEVLEAKNYLLTYPPRKQTLSDGKIVFVDQVIDVNQKPTQQILLMIRTIRNNLFHGGKYLPEGEREAGRNNLLVKYSLSILLACVKLDQEVRSNFEH